MLTPSGNESASRAAHSKAMTALSLHLSRALARGRVSPAPPASRADLLLTLLRKRAAAHNAGAPELESLLRAQIRWALPMQSGE